MANYPQELAQDAVCQSHTGHMTGLWFLPTRPLRVNTNELMNEKKLLVKSRNSNGQDCSWRAISHNNNFFPCPLSLCCLLVLDQGFYTAGSNCTSKIH